MQTSQYFGGSISGGAVGGYFSLEKYHEGVMAKEKALLIRNIVHDLAHVMKGVPESDPENLDKLIAFLKRNVPDPKHSTVVKDGSKQAEICRALADSINKRMHRVVVDTSAPAGEVCESVSAVLYSLFSGLKSEFMGVAQDVRRILGNMTLLRNSLESGALKLVEILRETGDASAAIQGDATMQMYSDLMKELDRQMAILSGLIGTTMDPTTKTIADLTLKDDEFRGFVKSLQAQLGTHDMSRKLTYTLSGINNVAIAADLINRALKTVGATVKDYKSAKDTQTLISKLYDIYQKKNKSPNSDELAKFIAAIEIIRKNDYAHADILKHLERGTRAIKEPTKPKSKKKKVRGGDSRVSLESRLERQRKTREVLFRDFETRLDQLYKTIMSNVESLAKRIGVAIPLDDNLAQFNRVFKELGVQDGWEREDFYLALTGYRQDAVSKDERANFLGRLDAVSRAIVPLQKGPAGEYFRAVKDAIDALREYIDQFQDRYLKPITKTAISSLPTLVAEAQIEGGAKKKKKAKTAPESKDKSKDESEDIKELKEDVKEMKHAAKAVAKAADKVVEKAAVVESDAEEGGHSGADSEAEGGDEKRKNNIVQDSSSDSDDAPVPDEQVEFTPRVEPVDGGDVDRGMFTTLRQAAKHLDFFFKAAQTRQNLKTASKDMKMYGKDYEAVLGDAIGELVVQIKKEHDDLRKKYDSSSDEDGKLLKEWIDGAVGLNANPLTGAPALAADKLKEFRTSVKENALKLLKEQMTVKVEFLKTTEAVDLYMRAFADAIAASPSDVKDLAQLLKDVDIVGKWFTDRSGNSIAQLYESFPTIGAKAHDVTFNRGDVYPQASGEHYYKWVQTALRDTTAQYKAHFPANPFIGQLPGKTGDAEDSILDDILSRAQRSVQNFRALDNIISTFTKLGSQFGGIKPADKTFMHPGVIFKNLRRYMYMSSIVMGWRETLASKEYSSAGSVMHAQVDGALSYLRADAADRAALNAGSSHVKGRGLRMGINFGAGAAVPTTPIPTLPAAAAAAAADARNEQVETWIRSRFSVAMSSIFGDDGNTKNGFSNTWVTTDRLFLMVIKSMVAKIFTVIGTYSLLNKPLDRHSSISPVRMILGGSAGVPEVIAEAAELYIRVPLLAEFFRDALKFQASDGKTSDAAKVISMVPDFEGVWSGLLKIVFDDAKHIEEGSYSEDHVRALITEINMLYKKYRSAGDKTTVHDVIHALVAEVNRRYGILKQKEINQYLKERRRDETKVDYPPEERLDYNILDEKGVEGRRAAPSDRYDAARPVERKATENQWDFGMVDIVRQFREGIDEQIKELAPSAKTTSFDDTIRQIKAQLHSSKTNEERYKIILKAMQGVDQLNLVNQFKVVMFHEMIMAPLGTLYSLWTVLQQFSARIRSMDLADIEKEIEAVVRAKQGNVAGPAVTYASMFDRLKTQKRDLGRYLHPGFLPDYSVTPGVGNTAHHTYTRAADGAAGAADNILVYQGMYGFNGTRAGGNSPFVANRPAGGHRHLTWKTLEEVAGQAGSDEKARLNIIEGVKRFAVDRETLFEDLMNMVFAMGSDLGEMVQVKVMDKNLILEFGQLVDNATNLLNHVKKNIEKFRGVIDERTLRRVEGGAPGADSVTGDVPRNVGSIYWLDENLIERMFKGGRDDKKMSLAVTNEILQKTFRRLCSEWTVLARLDVAGNGQALFAAPVAEVDEKGPQTDAAKQLRRALGAHEKTLLRDSFDRPLSRLSFWDPLPKTSAGAGGHVKISPADVSRRPQLPHDAKRWLFSVIPHVGSLIGDGDDTKRVEAMSGQLIDLARQIWRAASEVVLEAKAPVAGITSPFRFILQPGGPADGLGGFAPAPADFWKGATHSGPWTDAMWNARDGVAHNRRLETENKNGRSVKVSHNESGIFRDSAGGNVRWHIFNTDSHTAAVPEGLPNTPQAVKLKQLIEQYAATFAQRDTVRQTSLGVPLPHRVQWYMDPEDPELGAYMLHQAPGQEPFDAGLLLRLNELLARFLYMGWDSTSRKLYAGLIAKFANGTHAQALKGKALNDVFTIPTNAAGDITASTVDSAAGFLGLPPQHVTVLASLARFMRNVLLMQKRNSNDAEYRVDSLMDIPIHMKESYRASLPAFSKLFRLALRKSEMLRQVGQQVSLVRQLGFLDKPGVHRDPEAAAQDVQFAAGPTGVAGHVDNYPAATAAANGMRVNPLLLAPNQWVHGATGFSALLDVPTAAERKTLNDAGWYNGKLYASAAGPGLHVATDEPAAAVSTHDFKRDDRIGRYRSSHALTRSENYAYEPFDPVVDLPADATRQWHMSLFDDLASMATSLDKCAMDVYKEMSDEPKYLETHEGMILDYQNLHKRQPIMILSQLQIALRNRFPQNVKDADLPQAEWDVGTRSGYARPNYLLPFYRAGEQPFKLLYGSRLILGRPDVRPGLEYMPGMQGLLDKYNGVSTGDHRVDKGEFESFAVEHARLIRTLADLRHYKPAVDGGIVTSLADQPLRVESVSDADARGRAPTREVRWPAMFRPYAMRRGLDQILALTESGSQDANLTDLVATIEKDKKPLDSRKNARIYNIIDMNIVPINPHALMRDTPLINLTNYSYTFDRMVQDALLPEGQENDEKFKVITSNYTARTSKGLLAKLLIHPYAELSASEFYGLLSRLITGDSGLDLGRPKFLGDQLWNKALLQDMYSMPAVRGLGNRPDESGPRADNSQSRIFANLANSPEVAQSLRGLNGDKLVNLLKEFLPNNEAWLNGAPTNDEISTGIRKVIREMIPDLAGVSRGSLEFKEDLANSPGLVATVKSLIQLAYRAAFYAAWSRASTNFYVDNVLDSARKGIKANVDAKVNHPDAAAIVAAAAAIERKRAGPDFTDIDTQVDILEAKYAAAQTEFKAAGAGAANIAWPRARNAFKLAVTSNLLVAGPPPALPAQGTATWMVGKKTGAAAMADWKLIDLHADQKSVTAAVAGKLAGLTVPPGMLRVRMQDGTAPIEAKQSGVDIKQLDELVTSWNLPNGVAPLAGLVDGFQKSPLDVTLPRGIVVGEIGALTSDDVRRTVASMLNLTGNSGGHILGRDLLGAALGGIIMACLMEHGRVSNSELAELDANNGALQYPDKDESGKLVIRQAVLEGPSDRAQAGDLDNQHKNRHDVALIGRMRFDTTLMRNIFFLVNLQRVMRMLMRNEISYLESPVVSSSQVINRQITEYVGNETYSSDIFHP